METNEVKEEKKSINLQDAIFSHDGCLYRFLGVSTVEIEVDKDPVQIIVLGNIDGENIVQVSLEVLNAKYQVLSPVQVVEFYRTALQTKSNQVEENK